MLKISSEVRTNPAAFFEAAIGNYIASSPNNVMPSFPGEHIWDEPVVAFASGDDPLFQDYKKIIGDFHFTPREALETHIERSAYPYHPEKVSVITWALPSTRATRLSMREETQFTSLRWNYTRWYGQEVNARLSRHLVSLIESMGGYAVSPEQERWFEVKRDIPNAPASVWSLRHIAYAAGLGTFSLNDGFITPVGIAIRLGSVVCDLDIPPTPRLSNSHQSNCLFYRTGDCGKCIKRCPAGAITEQGHDRAKCSNYQSRVMPAAFKIVGRDNSQYVGNYLGCGLCQTGVPCEGRIPASKDRVD
ncbi:MAG: epoxyqueuosine reductase [Chloroflexi bacterium]|nr:epoxyqueuosine reductase [Chloroflexota bacterium]